MLGAIEAGGTKFVLAVGTSPLEIAETHTIPTRTPDETLAEAADWFAARGKLDALGIASFGPVDLDPASSRYGFITNTPKPGWKDCDVAGYFARTLDAPVGWDTDVNGAALAEYTHGAGRGSKSLAYVTIGTGIGGGLVVNGKPVHGAAHPEVGHIFPRRHDLDIAYPGHCPLHGDCLEGLAAGPSVMARWGKSLSELSEDHEAHDIVAHYIAQLCHILFATISAETIVLGGGVSKAPGLIDRVRAKVAELDAGYLPGSEHFRIVQPGLGERSGITGAMQLAEEAAA